MCVCVFVFVFVRKKTVKDIGAADTSFANEKEVVHNYALLGIIIEEIDSHRKKRAMKETSSLGSKIEKFSYLSAYVSF